jgi:hypothetical protein
MKFLCEGCERLITLESYVLDAQGLAVVCQACGAWSRAAPSLARAPAPGSMSPAPGDEPPSARTVGEAVAVAATAVSAPGSSRPSVTALRVVRSEGPAPGAALDGDPFQAPPGHCPKCVAPMREEAGACAACGLVFANFIPEEHQPSEALAGEWRALLARWGEPDAHDEVMTQAMARGELAMVGRLYRVRLARAPNDALAQRGRDEVVRRVTSASPLASDGPSPELGRKMKNMVMGGVLLVALLLALLLAGMLRGSF